MHPLCLPEDPGWLCRPEATYSPVHNNSNRKGKVVKVKCPMYVILLNGAFNKKRLRVIHIHRITDCEQFWFALLNSIIIYTCNCMHLKVKGLMLTSMNEALI